MTDRELLELAAKAYGLEGWIWDEQMGAMMSPPLVTAYGQANTFWAPHRDDGESRRLEVALWLQVRQVHGAAHAGYQNIFWETVPHGDDPLAATRLAVLRAAVRAQQRREAGL